MAPIQATKLPLMITQGDGDGCRSPPAGHSAGIGGEGMAMDDLKLTDHRYIEMALNSGIQWRPSSPASVGRRHLRLL